MADETISEKCETLYNKLNTFVTSIINRDVTPKISNLNTEVWGSNTQTGTSRIDTLNTNYNNLDGSITTMESDINNIESDISTLQTNVTSLDNSITNKVDTVYYTAVNCNSNLSFTQTTPIHLYRVGKVVVAFIWNASCKPTGNIGWKNIANIPTGYRPIRDTYLSNTSSNQAVSQYSTDSSGTVIRAYVGSIPSTTVYAGFSGVWFTNDDTPSQ